MKGRISRCTIKLLSNGKEVNTTVYKLKVKRELKLWNNDIKGGNEANKYQIYDLSIVYCHLFSIVLSSRPET